MPMKFEIKKASKTQAWLRMGISGPAGAGKTYTALKLASEMDDGKIIVIDTQRGQANHYGNQFDFDIIDLADHHPQNFIDAMNYCAQQGYKYIIIDSMTHEWTGKNGCLELHEEAVTRQKVKNTFTAWKEVTPLHNKFFETVNSVAAHVIGTIRSKVDYVQEKDEQTGRTAVKKLGMATVQREGSDYELDVLLEMEIDHTGMITKCRDGEDRALILDGKVFKKPGKDLAETLKAWLTDGAPARDERAELEAELKSTWIASGKNEEDFSTAVTPKVTGKSIPELKALLADWKEKVAQKQAPPEQPVESASPKTPRETLNAIILELKAKRIPEHNIADQIAALCDGVWDLNKLPDGTVAALIPEFSKWLDKINAAGEKATAA